MPIRPILVIPDPRLRAPAAPVERVDDELRALANDMLETMYDAPGIGLAAPQVGVLRRLVVADVAGKGEAPAPMILVNPRVTWASEERASYDEGCLSVPEVYEPVERPARVRVAYTDETGEAREVEADGLLATCLQHEIDHLDGRLFLDHLSRLKRELITRRFAKAARHGEPPPKRHRAPPARRLPRIVTPEAGEL